MTRPFTDSLREFWSVPTLERAQHERVTVPPQPEAWEDQYQERIIDTVFRDVPFSPGMRLLDFGCGVGRLARPLAKRGYHVLAVDVSPAMLDHCATYCTGVATIETVLSDGWGVAHVPNDSVDGAYSFYVFQHMPSTAMASAVLGDLHRVLRTNGWCVVQTVDIGEDVPVRQAGFHGERQTANFLLNSARAAGFRQLRLDISPDNGLEYLVLTARK